MSNNAFRVKNSLHLTPQAVEPSGLEVGDLWMDIDGNLKRWDGSASQDVGSGGVGSVDIMFAQTLEQAVIGDFTTTGTVAIVEIATNPLDILQGKKTLKITHTGGASAEQIVEVPAKFRNKNVTLSLDVASDALSGNLSLTVTDQTNTVTLINAESIQPQEAGQTSVKRSVSFNVPSDCEELKYKFTAVSESGAISLIDNVVIELTETARLSTTIEVPILEEYIDYGAIDIRATTTNPTKGTIVHDKFHARRSGSQLDVRVDFHQSTAGTAGSGTYYIQLPNSLQVDVAKIPSSGVLNGVVGSGVESESGGVERQIVFRVEAANPSRIYLEVVTTSTSNLQYSYTPVSSSFLGLNTALVSFSGTMTLPILGWEATETQSVSLAQTVLVQESDSYIRVNTANGSGSTATRVRKYSGSPSSVGDAARFEQDDVNGARFIIQKSGIFTIMVTEDALNGATHGMTKNLSGAQLSTSIDVLLRDPLYTQNVLATQGDSGAMNGTASWTGPLVIGDIIRPQHNGQTPTDNDSYSFQLTYQGSLKQLNVSENQKIEIPTSELRMEGASSRGSTATAIVRFDNIAKLRGDAFTVESDAALGTRITMKKKGKLDISTTLQTSTYISVQITKNQQGSLTGLSATASEIIATSLNDGSGPAANNATHQLSSSIFVEIGDVFRVAQSVVAGTPYASANNSLNLSFQEQEVSVSVTNVLPQFSESDSSVRVDTANGYGSTATKIRRFSNVRDNLGSAITYADSATAGSSFTVNEDGIYNISYTEYLSVQSALGITLNSANLTTNVNSLAINTNNEVLALTNNHANSTFETCNWSGFLQKDDVIRAHSNGDASGDNDAAKFTISKVGKPNVTGVDVTPFAKIEYEVVDSLFISGNNNGAGSTWTNFRRFTGLTSFTNRGVIRYVQDAAFGDYFEALKPCKMDISWSGPFSSGGASSIYIVKNPTTNTISSGQQIAFSDTGTNLWNTAAGSTELQVGDRIRLASVAANTFTSTSVSITATELRDAYQVIGGGVENTYSAIISSTPSIQTQSYPFIDSVTSGGTGAYNINLKAGFFPVIPSVSATSLDSNGRIAAVTSITTSLITVRTFNDVGTNTASPFSILVQRQGSDYRTPSKAIGLPAQRVAVIRDEKANNTAGQTISTTYVARQVNTLEDPSGIVLNSSSFTGVGGTNTSIILGAGKYYIRAISSLGGGVGQVFCKIRLYNATDLSVLEIGMSNYTNGASGDDSTTNTFLEGYFELSSQKTLELQQRNSASRAGGSASNFGDNEVYTTIVLEKVEE